MLGPGTKERMEWSVEYSAVANNHIYLLATMFGLTKDTGTAPNVKRYLICSQLRCH